MEVYFQPRRLQFCISGYYNGYHSNPSDAWTRHGDGEPACSFHNDCAWTTSRHDHCHPTAGRIDGHPVSSDGHGDAVSGRDHGDTYFGNIDRRCNCVKR